MDLQSSAFSQLGDARARCVRYVLALSDTNIGAEREIRTLETNLEDSHVSSYIISASYFRFKIAD
jgi:hypothetical protein